LEAANGAIWTANYEKGVRASLQYPEVSVFHLLERTVKRYPQRVATNFNGAMISYRNLFLQVNKLSNALARLGIKKGDRVGVILPNTPQSVISYFAILQLGAIAVFINPLHAEMELQFFINDVGIKTLIIIDTVYRKVMNIKGKIDLENLIVTGIHDYLTFPYNILYPLKQKSDGRTPEIIYKEGIYKFTELLRNAPDSPPGTAVQIAPREDVAVIQYTGGVSGKAKGAMLTHYNMVANVLQFREWFSACKDGEERFLCAPPFSHIYGLTCVMNFGVYIGATLILLPRFDVDRVLKIINRYRPTFFPGVPTMYVAINNHPEVKKYDISSISYCISGAAPLPFEVQDKFEHLTGARLVEAYGLAEASPATHCNPVRGRRKIGSIGLPLPDTMAKIVDLETGEKELAPGEVGELVISGPQVMKGYWNNPEETAATIRNGWLYTGDIAQMDKDGYFYIINRKKEMIITGGYNVYPREIEEVLKRHPKIKEAVVVGIPDDYYGEAVKAYVFPKDGKSILEDELRDYCLNKLASYKIPRHFEIRKDLPKQLTGAKLRRYLIKEQDKQA